MIIPVKVKEIAYDIMMNPVILLSDEDEQKALPIWVGPLEAHSIGIALQGVKLDRPLTHDLLNNIFNLLDAKLNMVVVSDIIEGTYFAELHIWFHNKEVVVDCRPSDAIALALRTGTPIYLSEKVAENSLSFEELLNEEQPRGLKELLEPDGNKKSLH